MCVCVSVSVCVCVSVSVCAHAPESRPLQSCLVFVAYDFRFTVGTDFAGKYYECVGVFALPLRVCNCLSLCEFCDFQRLFGGAG